MRNRQLRALKIVSNATKFYRSKVTRNIQTTFSNLTAATWGCVFSWNYLLISAVFHACTYWTHRSTKTILVLSCSSQRPLQNSPHNSCEVIAPESWAFWTRSSEADTEAAMFCQRKHPAVTTVSQKRFQMRRLRVLSKSNDFMTSLAFTCAIRTVFVGIIFDSSGFQRSMQCYERIQPIIMLCASRKKCREAVLWVNSWTLNLVAFRSIVSRSTRTTAFCSMRVLFLNSLTACFLSLTVWQFPNSHPGNWERFATQSLICSPCTRTWARVSIVESCQADQGLQPVTSCTVALQSEQTAMFKIVALKPKAKKLDWPRNCHTGLTILQFWSQVPWVCFMPWRWEEQIIGSHKFLRVYDNILFHHQQCARRSSIPSNDLDSATVSAHLCFCNLFLHESNTTHAVCGQERGSFSLAQLMNFPPPNGQLKFAVRNATRNEAIFGLWLNQFQWWGVFEAQFWLSILRSCLLSVSSFQETLLESNFLMSCGYMGSTLTVKMVFNVVGLFVLANFSPNRVPATFLLTWLTYASEVACLSPSNPVSSSIQADHTGCLLEKEWASTSSPEWHYRTLSCFLPSDLPILYWRHFARRREEWRDAPHNSLQDQLFPAQANKWRSLTR